MPEKDGFQYVEQDDHHTPLCQDCALGNDRGMEDFPCNDCEGIGYTFRNYFKPKEVAPDGADAGVEHATEELPEV